MQIARTGRPAACRHRRWLSATDEQTRPVGGADRASTVHSSMTAHGPKSHDERKRGQDVAFGDDPAYRAWHTAGRGTEQPSHSLALIDIPPWGRREEWLDSPEGWPSRPTYSGWLDSPDVARAYGPLDDG
jgi:hypothetical protein